MELLTSKEKVALVLQVAAGYQESDFDVYIREAQDFDLKPLLCESFYFELINNKEDADKWQLLLAGGSYVYKGNTFYFRGVQDVLAYFTYARFVLKCNYVSTSHGFTIKQAAGSVTMPLEERRNLYYKYQKEANLLLDDVLRFIERHPYDYASYFDCKSCNSVSKGKGFKTTVIK